MKLAGNNIVQILDIINGESWRGPLESLFERFSSNITYENNHEGLQATLTPKDMRITDWTGWSQVESIKRYQYPIHQIEWVKVSLHSSSVICTSDSVLPVWNLYRTKRVFQGRPTWEYQCKSINELDIDSQGRLLEFDSDAEPSFFANYIIAPIDHDRTVYYEINTFSKFYNVSKILDTSKGHGSTGWK